MNDKIFYLPIYCCEQEMSEIFQDKERVQAICQKCGKVWRPKPNPNIRFTKFGYIVVDEWPLEKLNLPKNIKE